MACEIRIGTSGYHYRHWRGPFYPEDASPGRMLDFYTRHFDTVELNNSFYRLPDETTFDEWRNSTPANFIFAVKASRYITHLKKLHEPENALERLIPRALHLGKKLGPILFQLPPAWKVNVERLGLLLELLPPKLRFAFEFRDVTWITPEVNELLARFHAAFCIYELAGYQSPLTVTTDFAYVRLHGPGPGKYQNSYERKHLSQWARTILEWSTRLKAVYVYFDNDQLGYAARDALTLKRMVAGSLTNEQVLLRRVG